MNKNFIGMDGFVWFIGVVEDRDDPYLIGRVKVRCFGHHTKNIFELPTEDLPWAQVMLPVTSAGISGIGQSPTGLVEGSHVFGFFRDGEDRQEPVVMGSLPGYPIKSPLVEEGIFTQEQANQADILSGGFRDPKGVYPKYTGAPDTSQLATMVPYNPDFHFSYVEMTEQVKRFQNIGTAIVEPMQLASAFISKGGGSIFGIVADIITGAVANVIGANVLGPTSTLGGFTTDIKRIAGNISTEGTNFLQSTLGLTKEVIENSANLVEKKTISQGVIAASIKLTTLPSGEDLLKAGMSLTGTDDIGNFILNVDSPDTMKQLFSDAAEAELINNYNKADARVKAGLSVINTSASRVLDPSILGVRGALGTVETTLAQSAALDVSNSQLRDSAGAASQGSLLSITDKLTGVVTAVAEDFGSDALTQIKTAIGDQGISIPQKATVTKAGIDKLMNNFIGANSDSFSMPDPPAVSGTYPHRHVYETESGHIMMYDDNENSRTIQQRHATGTQYMVFNDGTKLDHIVSDHIIGVEGTSYTNIQEDQIVTLNGRYKIFVNKDEQRDNNYDIVVGKNANINIQVDKGDLNINILDGRINANCSDNFNMIVGGDTNIITQGDYTVNAGGEITLQGEKIYLN